ncbi:MAG: hypothetical protein ACLTKG_06520 [Collinsella intestinalis]
MAVRSRPCDLCTVRRRMLPLRPRIARLGGKSGRSGKRRGNVLSNILIAVGVALLLVAGGLLSRRRSATRRP